MDKAILEKNKIDEGFVKYSNDLFFHHLLLNNEAIRNLFCQQLISDRKIISTKVKNEKQYGKTYREKKLILDLLAEDKKTAFIHELFGGQQQRVAIARALASKPAIIFADEPTGNLDAKSSKEVVDLLKIAQRKYHETVVMVTHDEEIASIADRIITIEDGKIIQDTHYIL